MDSLPGREEEKKKHWHGTESFMGTKRGGFMIILKDEKLEGQKPWLSYGDSVIAF